MGGLCGGGGGTAGDTARQQEAQQRQSITQATGQIDSAFKGFTPQFYNQRAQAYENYAEPQLMGQYQNTLRGLYGKLANQGLLNSSSAIRQKGALGQELATQQQGVANEGIRQSQSLQQQVSSERNNLVGQANAASNPLSIAQGALGSAASFAAPSAFAPIGQAFQNFSQTYLGSQLNNSYNPALYGYYLGGNRSSGGPSLGSSTTFG